MKTMTNNAVSTAYPMNLRFRMTAICLGHIKPAQLSYEEKLARGIFDSYMGDRMDFDTTADMVRSWAEEAVNDVLNSWISCLEAVEEDRQRQEHHDALMESIFGPEDDYFEDEYLDAPDEEDVDFEDIDCADCGLKFLVNPALYGAGKQPWPTQCSRCQQGLAPVYEY